MSASETQLLPTAAYFCHTQELRDTNESQARIGIVNGKNVTLCHFIVDCIEQDACPGSTDGKGAGQTTICGWAGSPSHENCETSQKCLKPSPLELISFPTTSIL